MIKNIFIVGTGRSGTHFLCRSLLDFSNIDDRLNGREDPNLLRDIALSAINHTKLLDITIKKYKNRTEQCNSNNKIFLDQHHPIIHHIQQIDETFKDSIFLGLDRPIEQIVASMIEHNGVKKWFELAKKNTIPFPNKFLGVKTLKEVTQTPLHLLCAKRVIAHKNLNKRFYSKENFRLIDFENFVKNKEEELYRVFGNDINLFGYLKEKEKSNPLVLKKYKTVLTSKEIKEIREYSDLHSV